MARSSVPVAGNTLSTDTAATASTLVQRDSSGNATNAGETLGANGLTLNGPLTLNWVAVSTTYAVLVSDNVIYADATGGGFNVTLPAPASVGAGRVVTVIKKNSANTVTILPNAAETINGSSSKALTTQYTVCQLYCDATNWITSTTTS